MMRRLTDGEISLAKLIYKDSIDYKRVRVYNRRVLPPGIQAKNRAMAFLNKISFPADSYNSDFSTETDPFKQTVFIHELGHIWQLQNKVCHPIVEYAKEMLKTKFNYSSCYRYELSNKKNLLDYNFEQQCMIIEDYFLIKYRNVQQSRNDRRIYPKTAPDLLLQYEMVLKKFLHNPRQPKIVKVLKSAV